MALTAPSPPVDPPLPPVDPPLPPVEPPPPVVSGLGAGSGPGPIGCMSSPPPVDPPPPPVGKFFINQLAPSIIPASLAALYMPLVNLSPFNVLSSSRRPAATPATVPTPAPAIVAP